MRPAPFKCLFCSANGPFTRNEHPIPESLGNDDTVLGPGFVCDNCNQYFGSKIEHFVLSCPPFSIDRVTQAVKTKKGKYPKASLPGSHLFSMGYWDTVLWVGELGRTPPTYANKDGGLIICPPSPKDDAHCISRFLLKMGLELLLLADAEDPYSREFDCARAYARYGRGQGRWDLGYGHYPRRSDLVVSVRVDEIGPLETRQIYQYEMGVMSSGDKILCFAFVDHCFACNLSQPSLAEYLQGFNLRNEFRMELMR